MSFYTKNKEGFLVDIPMEKVETLLNNDVKVYTDKDLISELNFQKEKLQEQNKELLELLKEADSLIDDYLNWRDEKRMDYFDIRARKLREALAKVNNENN